MEQSALLNKIKSAAETRLQEQIRKENDILTQVDEKMKRVKALGPRIYKLCELAVECLKNGISVGPPPSGVFQITDEYISNGITHKIGFIPRYEQGGRAIRIIGVGIVGGGCNGKDVIWDWNGTYLGGEREWNQYRIQQKLDRFLNGFDKFENDFISYINNL